MDLSIEEVKSWEALDSRGTPTVACLITLRDGASGHAMAPSGASTGTHEAYERRDGGTRLGGKGVRQAVAAVNGEIRRALRGKTAADQEAIDELLRALDGTSRLEKIGANAVLAVSVACAIAAADAQRQPLWRSLAPDSAPLLPLPMVNILSGGAHAARMIDIQDVMAVPVGATSFSEAIEWACRVRNGTADELRKRGHGVDLVADEGGLAAALESNRMAVELVAAGIERSGLVPGEQVAIAVDVAATQLRDRTTYRFETEGRSLTARELASEIRSWCDHFPIVSVEDVAGDDDLDGWVAATDLLAERQLVGDDLFATSVERFKNGRAYGIANAVLVKPNQVGTLSDALHVVEDARLSGYAPILSARSGDTEDVWLADLAVGWRTGQIKVGSTMRSERTAKWNRLLRLEAEHHDAQFAGPAVLGPYSRPMTG